MPPDLASLLADAGLVTADDLERARSRQREAGGALDTAILELGLVPEPELARQLARAAGLPPAPEGLEGPDPRARRVFPARVAVRHGLAPYRLEERELSVLATYPVDLAVVDEISFMLSLDLVAHVAPERRVRELMARVYGTELPERFARLRDADANATGGGAFGAGLASRAAAGFAPSKSGAPPPTPPDSTSTSIVATTEVDDDIDVTAEEEVPPPRGGPEEPLAAALAYAVEVGEADGAATPRGDRDAPPSPHAPPHWTREEAFAALEAARGRDGVVAVALRYARDFFEAAALFTVARDHVSGHDAVGWPDARARCRAVRVPLREVGLFQAVVETSGPYLGPVAREPGNEAMLAALGRGLPRIALLYPVPLRGRTVCVLYADNGDVPVSPRRLGDLLLLAGALGGAFDRILRDGKRAQALAPAPATQESGWTTIEPARLAAPAPGPPAPQPPEPFEVAPAGPALAAPGAFDPVDAVRRLGASPRGSPERGRLVAQLVQHGPDAAAALRSVFPGPLDPLGRGERDLPLEDRGPVLSALAALGIVATPWLVDLLGDAEPVRRQLAATLLGRAGDPAAFLPLTERALDGDPAVAEAARVALAACRLHPDFQPVLERLRRALLGGDGEDPARAAAALARLGDAESVPLILQGLEGPEPLRSAAAAALAQLTGRRLGPDAAGWLAWWREHRTEKRADWLFGALASPDREARLAAAEELRASGGSPPSAWNADAPAAERAEAARLWRAWWQEKGVG